MKRIVGCILFALLCVLAGCGLHRALSGRLPASGAAIDKLALPTAGLAAPAPAAQTVKLAAAEIGEAAASARRLAVEGGEQARHVDVTASGRLGYYCIGLTVQDGKSPNLITFKPEELTTVEAIDAVWQELVAKEAAHPFYANRQLAEVPV